MFVFRKIWRALFFETPVLRFALMPYYQRNGEEQHSGIACHSQNRKIPNSRKFPRNVSFSENFAYVLNVCSLRIIPQTRVLVCLSNLDRLREKISANKSTSSGRFQQFISMTERTAFRKEAVTEQQNSTLKIPSNFHSQTCSERNFLKPILHLT